MKPACVFVLLLLIALTGAIPLEEAKRSSRRVLARPGERIAFGKLGQRGQFPWTVAIWIDIAFCGGVIINEEWILTAAACLDPWANGYRVIAGSTYISTGYDDPDRQMMNSIEAYVHEEFIYETLENDIGLIKLPQKLQWTDTVQPLNLTDEEIAEGVEATFSGYGATRQDAPVSTSYRLFYGNIVTISNADCQHAMHYPVYDSQLCAQSDEELGPRICIGDGGAPLTVNGTNGETILIGLGSFMDSSQNCITSPASGFSRVSLYRDWIRDKTGV